MYLTSLGGYNSYTSSYYSDVINEPPEYLKDTLKKLLSNDSTTDCSFVLQDPRTGKDVLYKGHQLQLAMASPVFKSMFYEQFLDHNIPIEGVEPKIFELFLEVAYMQEPDIESPIDAVALYATCRKFNAMEATKYTQRWIKHNCTAKNAIILYECAKEYGDRVIEEKCLQVSLVSTSSWM